MLSYTTQGMTSLQDHLEENDMRIFCSREHKNTVSTLKQASNRLRFDGRIIFQRPASEPLDTDWKGTYPRVEVSRSAFLKGVPFELFFDFSSPALQQYDGSIVQIVDRFSSGRTRPSFQLLVKCGCLWIREWTVNMDLSDFEQYRLCPLKSNSIYSVHINGVLSPDPALGCLSVNVNGSLMFSRRQQTATSTTGSVRLQYGCYGKPGTDLILYVHHCSTHHLEDEITEEKIRVTRRFGQVYAIEFI
jgi:hypothetical protein